ncbi:methylenetetrahydrofolate reductase [NAD(P)H] [Streptomyces sp. NPDC089799]|uniref:methylenetetrahydrofolate reductase [NAD(P)H] n=1 Tax=Streptomyces sp. NPDC089799 TaxID=3155066 RepID=UPI00342F3230
MTTATAPATAPAPAPAPPTTTTIRTNGVGTSSVGTNGIGSNGIGTDGIGTAAIRRTGAPNPGVRELLAQGRRSFSFELRPSRSEAGERALWDTVRRIESLAPSFVSVSYGAGGSSRARTVELTERIASDTTLRPVAHLTASGHSLAELRHVIGRYADAGIRDVLALRGDPKGDPRGEWTAHPEGLTYAHELVSLVRSLGDFTVGVAAFPERHPGSASWTEDIRHFADKCRAGADYAVTQMFFHVEDYLRFRDRLASVGCLTPVIPAIMPATDHARIARFAELSNARFPQHLAARLEAARNHPQVGHRIGVEYATAMAERLLAEGAPGLHYLSLNRSTAGATLEIHRNLGVRS